MENGKSLLKNFALLFLGIGTAGVVCGLLLLFISPSLWIYSVVLGSCFGAFLLAGAICMMIYSIKKNRRDSLLAAGRYVYADIVDIDLNVNQRVKIERISMNPYYIVCKYTGADGREYTFKSKSLLYNPSGLIRENRLKVYVELAKPKRYYVDTSSILPDNAILHKFQYDSDHNARMLMQGGQYIEAQTCGVELIGRIKVNSIVKPMFIKVTDKMAGQFQIPVDEKTVLLSATQFFAGMMRRMAEFIFLPLKDSGENRIGSIGERR